MDFKEKSKNNKTSLNVLLVQYAPITKKVKENIDKVNKILESLSQKERIDIVVFPEMTFTKVFKKLLNLFISENDEYLYLD